MNKENGKLSESIVDLIDGFLAVKPAGTIAALLPWPKKWISCDLLDGVFRIYNKEPDEEPIATLQLPGSEYCPDPKEPLHFSIYVKHPTTEQHHFRAENNEDYTMWIDTVRACGAASRTTRRTLSSTTSSRSSLISRCSSTDTDHGLTFPNGDEIEGITRRLQSLEESVYCSDEQLSDTTDTGNTKQTLQGIQHEVEYLKHSFDSCVHNMVTERKEHKFKERILEGEKIELMENVSTLKTQNDKLAVELTSEQNMRYKHSLELAQQMCINARQWEMRYLNLSLEYLKLQTFLQHIDSGFLQRSTISVYLEQNQLDTVMSIAKHTECTEPNIEVATRFSLFTDSLGFRTQFETSDTLLRYMCQQTLPYHIAQKLETTEAQAIRWSKYLDRHSDRVKRCKESKELCRAGVPSKLRQRVWAALINYRCSKLIKAKGPRYYQSLVQSPEISPSEKQITLDLHRSFPRNVYFNSDDGTKVPVLHRVLVAFSLHNRAIGYCQGMNMIAGMLIFHLEEEMVFWGLVAILEMIMPTGYYNTDLLAARADQIIFQELVESKMPCLAAYLKHHDIDLSLFSFNWFMTIFIDSLPMDCVIRLWDLFLLEGHKTLLRFSLALVKLHEYSLMQHQDSVSIFNMFRSTARSFYDSELVIKFAYSVFCPFPKRNELYKRHNDKLIHLHAEHAANERQWRERQQLHDTVDSDTWDIVPQQSVSPEPPSSCILHTCVNEGIMWAVHSEKRVGVSLLKIDLDSSSVVERSEVIENKVMCCTYTSGYVLLGTSNGYVLLYNCNGLAKLWTTWVMDCVLGIIVYGSQILAHLGNGSLVKFEGISETGLYCPSILDIGTSPIRTGVVVNNVTRAVTNQNNGSISRDQQSTNESATELWCSSGNTVHFVDLGAWKIRSKLCISSHSSTQIHRIVSYSANIVFISVHSTISVWDIHEKCCLSSHDCSSIFLPPPSPKSAKYPGARMSIHSLFYHSTSRTFWVGTTHGHVLIYEIGNISVPERDVDDNNSNHHEGSDEEASIAVLSRDCNETNDNASSVSPKFQLPPNQNTEPVSHDHHVTSEEENSITVLSEDHHVTSEDHQVTSSSVDERIRETALETSLVMVPSHDYKLTNHEAECESRDPLQQYDSLDSSIAPLSSSPNLNRRTNQNSGYVPRDFTLPNHDRRKRISTFNEYDVMEDHCDMIESPTDNDMSPVHVYQTFNRYHSQEHLEELEREGEYEVIVEDTLHKSSNILTLNTYQILSGDPIAAICTRASTDHILTCAGSVGQEGVMVVWKRLIEKDKTRWQAQPITISNTDLKNDEFGD